ncbi:MAG TPA: histidine decarboxylase [Micromonospora sp.]
MDSGTDDVAADLAALLDALDADRFHNIGFPGATDFDYTALFPLFNRLLNNVGDPFVDGAGAAHTKAMEREAIEALADLFRAPPDDRWGYVTSGGTEANLYGLLLGRSRYPDALVYYSEATHYSAGKNTELLGLPTLIVRAGDNGEIDYADLRWALAQHRHRPAIVHANVGTTMTEAIDDVGMIKRILRESAQQRHHVHVDAALAGLPLALTEPEPAFDLAAGADSLSVSGHKFIGSPVPYGVVLTRRSLADRLARRVSYTATPDSTIGGSRSGHGPLLLWYALRRYGRHGLAQRAVRSRELAAYTVRRLTDVGWEAWRNPLAFTVVLRTPPPAVTARWTLARGDDGWSHIVCVPGVTRRQIDAFVDDLAAAVPARAQVSIGRHASDRVRQPVATAAW